MAPKAKRNKRGKLREGGVRVSVYNEGLCVYLFDEGNVERLRALSGGKNTFFDALVDRDVGKRIAEARLAVAYTLEQDDEVSVEVIVGEALTPEELAVGCWLEVQHGGLALPTGRLRVETPNTVPLDPDEKSDAGGVVVVPPGEYAVTLHRIDWEEMERARRRALGVDEVIVLTPVTQAGEMTFAGPVLEFPDRRSAVPGPARLQEGPGRFRCSFIFLGYWETCAVNVTREVLGELGVVPGSLLRFRVEKFTVAGLYLGDWTLADFLRYFGRERLEGAALAHGEFAVGEWGSAAGKTCLRFLRVRAKKSAPVRLQDKWVEAEGEVLGERWELPQPAVREPAEVAGGEVRAAVAFSSGDEVVLNVAREQLEGAGVQAGDLLEVTGEDGGVRTLSYASSLDARRQHGVISVALDPHHERFYLNMLAAGLPYRLFTLPGPERPAEYGGELPVVRLGAGERWPVVGGCQPGVGQPQRMALRLTPFSRDCGSAPESWREGLEPGRKLTLRVRR